MLRRWGTSPGRISLLTVTASRRKFYRCAFCCGDKTAVTDTRLAPLPRTALFSLGGFHPVEAACQRALTRLDALVREVPPCLLENICARWASLAGVRVALAVTPSSTIAPVQVLEAGRGDTPIKPTVITAARGIEAGGKWIASGGDDHLVRIWNSESGTWLRRRSRDMPTGSAR